MSTLSPAEPGSKLVRSSLDSLFRALALRLAAIDLLIAVVLGALCMLVYGSEAPTTAVGLFTAALLARMALWLASLRTGLQALAPWYAQGIGIDDEGLRSAEQALDALPRRIDLSFVLGLALSLGVVVVLVWTRYPDALIIGAGDALALVLQAAAIVCSTPLTIRALTRVQLDDTRANLVAELLSRGMSPTTTKSKLAARFNAIAVLLVAVPLTWLSSLAWLSDVRNTRAVAVAEERRVVELAARDLADGLPLPAGLELAEELPTQLVDAEPLESSRATVVLHDELALVATETKDGRWLVGRRPVHLEHRNFLLMLVITVVTLGIWGLISVGSLTRSFLAAIRRVNHAVRRVVDVGDLVAMGPIPTYSGDELAELTHDFNRLLGELVGLAAMTQAVAAGNLTMRMEGRGDVSSAFASMLVQLHDVVAQIRETSVGLATAASEIHAATQEQETASEHLANGMRDVSRTMDSLATSATQIDGASKGVLENAERTLATTDEMARKIGELSERTKGISELLEVIRDVADRSDLLALNGSLESTRAGEAGRGFALVAAEMRRLAERVTGTVADVRELVVDIKASTATTVMATEQSRRLAENTAAAARRITAETQQQSADTTMASTNVREVANIIAQTSVATTQTRAAAEGLMMQADLLEQLVLKFELREGDAPAAAFAPEALRSAALAEAKRRFS